MEIIEKARKMADEGQGRQPRFLAPVPTDAAARRQYSFSRLTGMLHAQSAASHESTTGGDASGEPPLDARGLGTLVHAVLEEIDFASPGDIGQRVRCLVEQHLPGSGQRLDEPIEMIERFVASPRAAELASAKEVYRELEFMLAWPPGEAESGGRFLQVSSTACTATPAAAGGWSITRRTVRRPRRWPRRPRPTRCKCWFYALAAETILKTPPVELALCFLRPGLEYRFHWDAAARRRAWSWSISRLPRVVRRIPRGTSTARDIRACSVAQPRRRIAVSRRRTRP